MAKRSKITKNKSAINNLQKTLEQYCYFLKKCLKSKDSKSTLFPVNHYIERQKFIQEIRNDIKNGKIKVICAGKDSNNRYIYRAVIKFNKRGIEYLRK